MKESPIQVFSEIGQLKTVLVKRPGEELSHITPTNMEELLFSAILNWKKAGIEHDEFTRILRENNVRVVYLEDLVVETWNATTDEHRENFIKRFIDQSNIENPEMAKKISEFLHARSVRGMIDAMIRGISTYDLRIDSQRDVLLTQPMPNLYFTRDNFSSVGDGVVLSNMKYQTRQRETIFSRFIFKHHPVYKNTPIYFDGNETNTTVEGGDIFIYNNQTLVIGVSERTQSESIISIAKAIAKNKNITIKQIIAINVPKKWNLMHLDTWLTMVDYNKFLYSPNIASALKCWRIKLDEVNDDTPVLMSEHLLNLEDLLEDIIGEKPIMIPVAGNYSQEKIDIETHFDGTNFLVIKPGVVIGYDRNFHTIQALRNAGVEVLTFSGNQLSLGMGSARCMSMPLWRERVGRDMFSKMGNVEYLGNIEELK